MCREVVAHGGMLSKDRLDIPPGHEGGQPQLKGLPPGTEKPSAWGDLDERELAGNADAPLVHRRRRRTHTQSGRRPFASKAATAAAMPAAATIASDTIVAGPSALHRAASLEPVEGSAVSACPADQLQVGSSFGRLSSGRAPAGSPGRRAAERTRVPVHGH